MTETRQSVRSILFTAFEPSGDAHAAPVIRALRERAPDLRIFAWGGPKMAEAGAELAEQTVGDAAMGLNALSRVFVVRKQIRAIRRWLGTRRVVAHVAVDSPAANFPICRHTKRVGARVVHLVAPQLWAWGGWRARKLRKRTDLVLCLLPFEEQWFGERSIPARFVGHPQMNRALDEAALREQAQELPTGGPRIALFPGSRMHEVKANLGLLMSVYAELEGLHSGACGVIVAASTDIVEQVRRQAQVLPSGLHLVQGRADAAILWSDLNLAVSGTISLDIARQAKPMVGVYRTSPFAVALAKVLLRTPYRLLPNIIAEREVVPEFVPYCGGPHKVALAAHHFLADTKNAAAVTSELARVRSRFAGKKPAEESAELILRIAERGVLD